jgi:hypothetical protein
MMAHPFVDLEAILELGGGLVLGSKAVVDVDDDRRHRFGNDPAEEIVRVEVARHEPAAMCPDGDGEGAGLGGLLGRVQAVLDPVDLTVLALDRLGRWRELGQKHSHQLVILGSDLLGRPGHHHPTAQVFFQL